MIKLKLKLGSSKDAKGKKIRWTAQTCKEKDSSQVKVDTDLYNDAVNCFKSDLPVSNDSDNHLSDLDNETYMDDLSEVETPSLGNSSNEITSNVSSLVKNANIKGDTPPDSKGCTSMRKCLRKCYVSLLKMSHDQEVTDSVKKSKTPKLDVRKIMDSKGKLDKDNNDENSCVKKESNKDVNDDDDDDDDDDDVERRSNTDVNGQDTNIVVKQGKKKLQGKKRLVAIEMPVYKQGLRKKVLLTDYGNEHEDVETVVFQLPSMVKKQKQLLNEMDIAEREKNLKHTSLLTNINTAKEKMADATDLSEKSELDACERNYQLEEKFGKLDKNVIFKRKCIEENGKTLIDFLEDNLNSNKSVGENKVKSLNGENIEGFASEIVSFYKEYNGFLCESKQAFDVCPCCNMDLKSKEEAFCLNHFQPHMAKLKQPVEVCKRCHITLPSRWLALHCCICDIPRLTNKVNYWVRDIRDEVAAFTMKLCFGKDDKEKDTATCVECEEQFHNTFSLKYHFLQNHIFVYRHLGDCGMEFTNIADFAKHINPALVDNDSKTRCFICQYSFISSYNLEQHVLEKHPSISEGKCEKCGSWFQCKVHLQEHYCGKQVWLNEKKLKACQSLQCQMDNCGLWFQSTKLLVSHNWDAHGLKAELCNICGSSFIDRRSLKIHMDYNHVQPVTHPCYICGQMYCGRSAMSDHLRTHKKHLRWTCDKCGAEFKNRTSFFYHGVKKHPKGGIRKVFTCHFCSESYYNKDSYKQHILANNHVTDEQPLPDIKTCDHCGKIFGSAMARTRHINRQHSEKKVHCSVCEKEFSCKSNLRQHMWTHTGQRPRCEDCAIYFRSHRKLVEHTAEKHNVHMEFKERDKKIRKEQNKSQLIK
ncbi:zinc finger protein 560-like [Mya arenaria]|uniref:zinc finger protein 560-like n=1 Tax=Mya arenaria TaxID=6604 RepID=UPI0022E38E2B|nr:zinc finger protein 560-like [Mya arenaria]XP_052782523.1 zinc finger protein 560-like [Mya arenaria]XP_052782524.1 zinc finger protein 560-like [Mya arenaria]